MLCRAAQEKSRAPAVVVFAVGRDSLTEEACDVSNLNFRRVFVNQIYAARSMELASKILKACSPRAGWPSCLVAVSRLCSVTNDLSIFPVDVPMQEPIIVSMSTTSLQHGNGETMKTKTCTRCNGKGYGGWHVTHLGYPGGCFKCDLSGEVVTFTMKERVKLFIASCEKSLSEYTERAAQLTEVTELQVARRNERSAASAAKRGRVAKVRTLADDRWYQDQLESLRDAYRSCKRLLKAVRASGKVTADQEPATQPSRYATRYTAKLEQLS